ncbi:hypothetical protein DYB32_002303 [Aphanomyces invadans]|uniref:CLASP N-terminal domain-containing protein n=1 Tax=Aphanomyces invadans TaxID=157072 RepID=A0A418B3K9_9STRA|nr:hypothetical protein DYB32_002303 [Aphanomyces invadans]
MAVRRIYNDICFHIVDGSPRNVSLQDAFRIELADCHPAVVKQTCSLLGTLASTCGASFTSVTEALLVPILLMATKKKQTQVIAMAARQCLHSMTKSSRFAIVLLEKTYQHAKRDENLRMMCMSLVLLVLRYWDADVVLTNDAYTPLCRFIIKALEDEHAAVRTQGRMALCLLCEYGHERFAELLDIVPTDTMDAIVAEFPESLLAATRRQLLLAPPEHDPNLLPVIPEVHEDDSDEESGISSEDLSHVLIVPKSYWCNSPAATSPDDSRASPIHALDNTTRDGNSSLTESWVDRLDWSHFSDTSSTKDENVQGRAASMVAPPVEHDREGSENFADESFDDEQKDTMPTSSDFAEESDRDDIALSQSSDEWNGSEADLVDGKGDVEGAIFGTVESVMSMDEWLKHNRDECGGSVIKSPTNRTSRSSASSHIDSHDGLLATPLDVSPDFAQDKGESHVTTLENNHGADDMNASNNDAPLNPVVKSQEEALTTPREILSARLVAQFDDSATETSKRLARLEQAIHEWNAGVAVTQHQMQVEMAAMKDDSTSMEWTPVVAALRRQLDDELEKIACHAP